MKKVEAMIPAFRLREVKEEFEKLDVHDYHATEVKEFTGQLHQKMLYQGADAWIDFRHAIKIELVCPSNLVPMVKDAVVRVSRCQNCNVLLTVSAITDFYQIS